MVFLLCQDKEETQKDFKRFRIGRSANPKAQRNKQGVWHKPIARPFNPHRAIGSILTPTRVATA